MLQEVTRFDLEAVDKMCLTSLGHMIDMEKVAPVSCW